MFSHPDYDGREALLFVQDAASGLRALIAIHNTTLGIAFGGCRIYPYAGEQQAMTDVLRLSRGMTYNAAICLDRSDLEGLRVAVQGLGNVGMPLCGYLSAAGAALVVSDLDAGRCAQAAATYGATLVAPEEIYAQYVDVFAPAALGAVLNDATIRRLRCRVVCGGANNQLAEARHDAALAVRGIVFVPDYLANAGGVIDFLQETVDDQPDAVLASVARIGGITRDVLRSAAATGATPLSVADGIVQARIRRA